VTRTQAVILGIVVAAVAFALGWSTRKPVTGPGPELQRRQAPDFGMIPAHSGATCDLEGPDPLFVGRVMALPDSAAYWNTWRIPEYQDAQRFTDSPKSPYGPLVCVVARPDVGNVTSNQIAAGVMVGVIFVDGNSTMQAYRDLNITQAGFYCVILRGDVTQATIEGHIVPATNNQCAPISTSTIITSRPRQFATATNSNDYPAVASFAIKKSWRPAVGIRCADRWCYIGLNNLGDLEVPVQNVPPQGAGHVRHLVSGWFDHQHLGLKDSMFPYGIKASIQASIVPDDSLDGYTLADFSTRRNVAQVYVMGGAPSTKYKTVWGFTNTGAASPNQMALQLAGGVWQVYVNGALNTQLRVTRTDHSGAGFHIVGTARWKWNDRDEQVWVRCGEGCCWVEENPF